jgi:hypothetical protein
MAKTASPMRQAQSQAQRPVKPVGNLMVDLGVPSLVELDGLGYLPSRPEVMLTPKAQEAVKRLSLTLEHKNVKLSDGTQVRNSVQKTITWLCERLADSL